MHESSMIITVLFAAIFLGVVVLLKKLSENIFAPFTVLLLITGYLAQQLFHFFHLETNLVLSTDLIYYVLLPLLLFESSFKINAHQFKLQFKTITFLVTVGLLSAVFVVAAGLMIFLGFPFEIALLFGALISATDPIAVLSIFQSLGAPKRLALLAEGESMFNDATAVIVFRVVAGVVLAESQQGFSVPETFAHFLYIFFGSLLFGGILGFLWAKIIAPIKNDRLVETGLTVVLALLSFVLAETLFHLSGVISTVAAGVILGNIGQTKISAKVIHFIHEFWEFIGFVSIALVFFFSTFNINIRVLELPAAEIAIVIVTVLLSRLVSVYLSFFISNTSRFFADEPNVPMSWQHILNWGGLRGVIPLVLVYSLPDDFSYKAQFISYTIWCFFFTLFVNATTITWLLKRLRLHVPKQEQLIIENESKLFEVEKARERLAQIHEKEFSKSVLQEMENQIASTEQQLKESLLKISTPKEFELSLRLKIIEIERSLLYGLFIKNQMNESVFFEFTSELDLQQDALEYPEVSSGRSIRPGGLYNSQDFFLQRVEQLTIRIKELPWLSSWLRKVRKQTIINRLQLLRSRIDTSTQVVDYIEKLMHLVQGNIKAQEILDTVKSEHEQLLLKNTFQLQSIQRSHQRLYQSFERSLLRQIISLTG